jgi:hypothetical protein
MPLKDFLIHEKANPKYICCNTSFTLAKSLTPKNTLDLLKNYHIDITIRIDSATLEIVYIDKAVVFSIDTVKCKYAFQPSNVVINNYDFDSYLPLTISEIFEQFKLLELYN